LKISVITVCFNGATTIADTLDSIASQSHDDIEYIFVDGGSTDETIEIVRNHPVRVAKLISEPDKGLYDAMNKGWRLATGEYVGFLHADDLFADSAAIARIAAAATGAGPNVGAISADVDIVRQDDVNRVVRHYGAKTFNLSRLKTGYAPPYPGFFVRRKAYDVVGDYDLRYPLASDFDFIVRLLHVHKFEWKCVDHVLVKMREGGISSNPRAVWTMYLEVIDACKRHGIKTGYLTVATKYLSKFGQRFVRGS
jgi:glycosyltransferase involved in cell wall biosynthesis